ncbi:reverse transcriptase domain-containing protein [Tanacetum coccineum]
MLIDHEYVNCPLRFDDRIRPANLLPIHMLDFDVILGMDWLASHRATIDCYARTVIFGNVRQPEFVYHGSSPLKIGSRCAQLSAGSKASSDSHNERMGLGGGDRDSTIIIARRSSNLCFRPYGGWLWVWNRKSSCQRYASRQDLGAPPPTYPLQPHVNIHHLISSDWAHSIVSVISPSAG